ncbi:hypothetical protein CU254_12625 [Amycolatopsis sp. AA4]|uniref:hypothetical protein n=1 Tax=Actinomycetes TaxID=1760 RepID=UPI0001B56012|nr:MULTISPECIES: hypothetical protein [Actinomycetes]ATY11218.1 hypothetical protein CU254_12625 [Amycolatopsis sp. AA4]
MGFTTVPDRLRAAGGKARAKAARFGEADCAEAVGRIGVAVKGGKAAGAAGHCQESLSTTFAQWCSSVRAFGEHLGVAADRFGKGDRSAAGIFPEAPTVTGPR